MADLEIENREQAADWIETTLILRGRPIGFAALAEAAEYDAGLDDAMLVSGLQIMRQRQHVLGGHYPFDVSDIAVRVAPSASHSVYAALLSMSPGSPFRQLIAPQPKREMVLTFERLSARAAARLLGPSAEAVRFGWPNDDGRPERFSEAIDWLAHRMGVKTGSAFRPPRKKDGGVDVVAWRPFPDGRSGFPVSLIQCTLQKDVVPKSRDIDLRVWSGWLTLDVDPTTVLAIPGTIKSNEEWDEIALRSQVLDRIRISGLLVDDPLSDFEGALDYCHDAFSRLRDHLSGAQ